MTQQITQQMTQNIQHIEICNESEYFNPFNDMNIWNCFYEKKGSLLGDIKIIKKEEINKETDNKYIMYTFDLGDIKTNHICCYENSDTIEWMEKYVSYLNVSKYLKFIVSNKISEYINNDIEKLPKEWIDKYISDTETSGECTEKHITSKKIEDDNNRYFILHKIFINGLRFFMYSMLLSCRQIYFTFIGDHKDNKNPILLPIIWTEYNGQRKLVSPYDKMCYVSLHINSNNKTYEDISWNTSFPLISLMYSNDLSYENNKAILSVVQVGIYEIKENYILYGRNKISKIPQYCDVKLFFMGCCDDVKIYIESWSKNHEDVVSNIKYYNVGDISIIAPNNKNKNIIDRTSIPIQYKLDTRSLSESYNISTSSNSEYKHKNDIFRKSTGNIKSSRQHN